MKTQIRDQQRRAKAKAARITAKRPKLGWLMWIDGVLHECVSSEGLGQWHWGGSWVPYETIHGHPYGAPYQAQHES